MSTSKCRVCGREIRTAHGQFLCQTHWRMVPASVKGKLFAARECGPAHGKTALKAAESEAVRSVRAAIAKPKGGAL